MPEFDECLLSMIMQQSAEKLQALIVSMHPHVKSNATRSNTFKDAQKNSEKYLIQDDNTSNETLTMEDIFKSLTKGSK